MQPYQERVVSEKYDLDEKRHKLRAFMMSAPYDELPRSERERLVIQEWLMNEYSKILYLRIAAFTH